MIITTIKQTTDSAVPEKSGRNYGGGPIKKADKLMSTKIVILPSSS